MRHLRTLLVAASVAAPAALSAQRATAADTSISIDAIFRRGEVRSAPLPSVHWLKDGKSYLDLAPNAAGGADIVRVDVVTGQSRVIADAKTIVDENGQA